MTEYRPDPATAPWTPVPFPRDPREIARYVVPQPGAPQDRWFSSERAMGFAAIVLIGIVTVAGVLTAVADWQSFRMLSAYQRGLMSDAARLERADLASGALWIVSSAALLVAALVFLVWLWRVRVNAEMFCRGAHRHARGWVIGAWICPVVNLWFPKQVVDDVLAASDPRTPPRIESLALVPRTRLVRCWWSAALTAFLLDNATKRGSLLEDSLRSVGIDAALSTGSAVATCVAAVAVTLIIQRVNRFQTARPWIPWWATPDLPEPPEVPPGLPQYGPREQHGESV